MALELANLAVAAVAAAFSAATLAYMVRRDRDTDRPKLAFHVQRGSETGLGCIIQVAVSENSDWSLAEVRAVKPSGMLVRGAPDAVFGRSFALRPPTQINVFRGLGGLQSFSAQVADGVHSGMLIEVDCSLVSRTGKRARRRAACFCD